MVSKPFSLLVGAIAAGTLLSVGAQEGAAQIESNYVCYAIDGSGQVINLEPLCEAPQVTAADSQRGASTDQTATYQAFLDAFVAGASPESITIAELIGEENVIALGTSMCEFLATGASPEDLNVAFSATTLPPAFLQEVGNAAGTTLCTGT